MSDLRLPKDSEATKQAEKYRQRMLAAFPHLEGPLQEYEAALDEKYKELTLEREGRLMLRFINREGLMLERAGTYSVVLGEVNETIAKQLQVMTDEFVGMRRNIDLILEAFHSLHDIELFKGQDDITLQEASKRVTALVEQTKRIVALSERKGESS